MSRPMTMRRFVKVRANGVDCPEWLLWVDPEFAWTDEQAALENQKQRAVASMAFLDHGVPILPAGVPESMDSLVAPYMTEGRKTTFLVYEGGRFIFMQDCIEITATTWSRFYPRIPGAAVVCENDPYDKNGGRLDNMFLALANAGGAGHIDYMFSFRHREEAEVVAAFRGAPTIVFASSHTEADWWELMIRCILKSGTKAKVVGKIPSYVGADQDALGKERYRLCVEMAAKFGVNVIGIK